MQIKRTERAEDKLKKSSLKQTTMPDLAQINALKQHEQDLRLMQAKQKADKIAAEKREAVRMATSARILGLELRQKKQEAAQKNKAIIAVKRDAEKRIRLQQSELRRQERLASIEEEKTKNRALKKEKEDNRKLIQEAKADAVITRNKSPVTMKHPETKERTVSANAVTSFIHSVFKPKKKVGSVVFYIYRTKHDAPLSTARCIYTETAPWNWTVDTIYQTIMNGLRPPLFLQAGDIIVLEHGDRNTIYRIDESARLIDFQDFEEEHIRFVLSDQK